jgi:ankyrin repeat protein
VTHSCLVRLPTFRERLYASARLLLDKGADPNQAVGSRCPPASLSHPSEEFRLSALYGAAGRNHDSELTRVLLEAGADPNDGESLYHALESVACTRLLLEAGARIRQSNAMYRIMDLDNIETLRLLLSHGGDPNEPPPGPPTSAWGTPLLWAIRRRRSLAHVAALIAAGADPRARTPDGTRADTWALRFGLPEVATLLQEAGGVPDPVSELPEPELLIATCATIDVAMAGAILARRPGVIGELTEPQCGFCRSLPLKVAGRRSGSW